MGQFTSQTQSDLKQYLSIDYQIANFPSLINKKNNKPALVHQIITDSIEQAQKIRSDVNLYQHLKCQSINDIIEYFPLDTDKICSEQQFHYIVQNKAYKFNLKQQFTERKNKMKQFTNQEILSIIKMLCCALNIYYYKFKRIFHTKISLQQVLIEQNNLQLRLNDPLLGEEKKITKDIFKNTKNNQSISSSSSSSSLAPEINQNKTKKFNQQIIPINEFFTNIYSVGVIALELNRMKEFNENFNLKKQINSISNEYLKKAIQILLSTNPQDRRKIIEHLKIQTQEKYCLENCYKYGKVQQLYHQRSLLISQNIQLSNSLQSSCNPPKTSFSFGVSSSIINSNNQKLNGKQFFETNQPFILSKVNKNYQQNQTIMNATFSNLSTERTMLNQPYHNQSNKNFNSVINFNKKRQSNLCLPFSHQTTNFNQNVPTKNFQTINPLKSNTVHHKVQFGNTVNINSNSFINTNSLLKESLRSSDYILTKPSIAHQPKFSILYNQSKRNSQNLSYSSLKVQQKTPFLTNKGSGEEGIKKIFDKFSHVNFSNTGQSPNKIDDNKLVQDEMKRLLKVEQSQFSNKRTTLFQTPINLDEAKQVSSNKQVLDLPHQIKQNFVNSETVIKEKISNDQQNEISLQTEFLVKEYTKQDQLLYRPNKEVEQILKRLGIGSLLYGGDQTRIQQQLDEKIEKKVYVDVTETERPIQEAQIFVHKGNYNINQQNLVKKQPAKLDNFDKQSEKQADQQEVSDRSTTPIRQPVNRHKYNSTIVEVGDQDSQYSSRQSLHKNKQFNEKDLGDREYVVEQYQTGSKYEGQKLNGKRDGHGQFFYQDGGYYDGEWENNKMDGWGKLFYEGGKLAYEGHWKQDEFHGFGKVYNDNPIPLECGFDFTNFDYLQDYWEFYEGNLVKDTKQGRGKIKLTNGEYFEGDFHNDRIQGFGKYFMLEGNTVEGIWRDSKLIKIISS